MKRKRKERRLCGAPPRTNRVNGAYQFPPFLQPLSNGTNGEVKFHGFFHQGDGRRCVACSVPVDNSNLGGHDHATAFYDPIYCYPCADGFPRPLLPPGGLR
ncbi:MAG TPA: hypothetical protein VKD89_06415 [Candidatus Udaeobacter sp.]|nr:hypothetical protein [Candidatus Udaeobacter sp.]